MCVCIGCHQIYLDVETLGCYHLSGTCFFLVLYRINCNFAHVLSNMAIISHSIWIEVFEDKVLLCQCIVTSAGRYWYSEEVHGRRAVYMRNAVYAGA